MLNSNLTLLLADFVTVIAALIIYGSQLTMLKKKRTELDTVTFNRMPGVKKGKIMLHNKIKSWLSRRPVFLC